MKPFWPFRKCVPLCQARAVDQPAGVPAGHRHEVRVEAPVRLALPHTRGLRQARHPRLPQHRQVLLVVGGGCGQALSLQATCRLCRRDTLGLE